MVNTIIESVIKHAVERPNSIAFRYLVDMATAPQELTFAQLLKEAKSVAVFLSRIAAPGSRIMLFFPPGMSYVTSFYGCLLAGMVAVPLYPPRRNVKSDRIIKVAQSCQSMIALTTASELSAVKAAWQEQNTIGLPLDFYTSDSIATDLDSDFVVPGIDPASSAFLQYTSGSTGTPKGVVITHQNIIGNVKHLSLMSSGNRNDVFVNWLPLFHDLGLITAVLWPVYLGASSTLMAPATFVREPAIWLKAITRYRGSMCGAPNFAYDLCFNKVPEAELAALDLSSWRVAYNAAEPVRAETLNQFSARFAACGFRDQAFYPGYGMAEATVFITGGDAAVKPVQLVVDKKVLAGQALALVDEDHPQATRIVACGTAYAPHDVRIVDPQSCALAADGQVGEIWFAGPSVSPGYWQLDELNAVTFNQSITDGNTGLGYLRTGDLGLMWQGQLYVTGRIKDLIILRGRNYYPQDIENSASNAHKSIRSGYVAAFSMSDRGVERLVLVAEIEREHFRSINADEVIHAIRHQIALDHEASVDQVVLLKPYKIPVTSSGKIQRRQTRQMLVDNELDTIADSGITQTRHYVDPVTDTEKLLVAIWCEVLKLDRLGVDDDFFEIGGDSIAGLEIGAAIQKQLAGVEFDVAQLQEFPTVARLAQLLDLKIAHAKNKQLAKTQSGNKVISI